MLKKKQKKTKKKKEKKRSMKLKAGSFLNVRPETIKHLEENTL